MKKYFLLVISAFLFSGCFQSEPTTVLEEVPSSQTSSDSRTKSEKSDTKLQGMMGTYEVTNVSDIINFNPGDNYINPITATYEYTNREDGSGYLSVFGSEPENSTSVVTITMNYTNTFFNPVTPKDAVQQDFVVEHEDESTISTMNMFIPAYTTDSNLKGKTIKVGGTAEIEFTLFITTNIDYGVTDPGTIFLRNNTGSGVNGNLFEKVIATIPTE